MNRKPLLLKLKYNFVEPKVGILEQIKNSCSIDELNILSEKIKSFKKVHPATFNKCQKWITIKKTKFN